MFETNPRIQFRNHRERGPAVRGFTLNDVAELSGKALSTVRSGFRIGSLETAVRVITRSWARSAKEATEADMLAAGWLDHDLRLWAQRWPLVRLWRCPRCPGLTLARGACYDCGGCRPPIRFGPLLHFEVDHGTGHMPLHRLIMGSPPGLDVHHIDYNRWNNRRENLVALTRKDHMRLHQGRLLLPEPVQQGLHERDRGGGQASVEGEATDADAFPVPGEVRQKLVG